MKRLDTTDEQYQRSYRGKHRIPGNGVWSYPTTTGRGTSGTRFLRCPCGWRLVEIKRSEHDKASAAFREHVASITDGSGANPDSPKRGLGAESVIRP